MNRELVASIAVFKSMYKAKKGNVVSIISQYILSAMKSEQKEYLTEIEISDMLKVAYGLSIPNAVVKKVLTTNQELFKWTSNGYGLQKKAKSIDVSYFEQEIHDSSVRWEKTITEFLNYVASERGYTSIGMLQDKDTLKKAFLDYVMDDSDLDKDSPTNKLIMVYIIERDSDEEFQDLLDDIREGMVIYEGMRYSASTNENTWKTDTVFVLDAQYLFSSFGLNSSYNKACFDDFYTLVQQINKGIAVGANGRRRITLKYFPETRDIMEKFFAAAVMIKQGNPNMYPSSEAMVKIVNSCEDDSDVLLQKARLYEHIHSLGITLAETPDLIQNKAYLFETEALDNLLEEQFDTEDVEYARDLFKFADYINIWREGKTVRHWENCKYVFLSDSSLTNKVSSFLKRNDSCARTPVFMRMEWFTQKMWFASNRPLFQDESMVSFSVLNRAKSYVSSMCKDSVAKAYKEHMSSGDTDKTNMEYYSVLRSYDYSFESIDASNVKEKINYSPENAYKAFLEAKDRAAEKSKLQQETIEKQEKKINTVTAEVDNLKAEKEAEEYVRKKYGLFLDFYTPFALAIVLILILVSIIVKFGPIYIVCSLICIFLVCTAFAPSFRNKRNVFKQQLIQNRIREITKNFNTK